MTISSLFKSIFRFNAWFFLVLFLIVLTIFLVILFTVILKDKSSNTPSGRAGNFCVNMFNGQPDCSNQCTPSTDPMNIQGSCVAGSVCAPMTPGNSLC